MKNRRTENHYHKSRAEDLFLYNKAGQYNSGGDCGRLEMFLNDYRGGAAHINKLWATYTD